ncbi:protein FAR1-RELATED SEQUENCE 5-like [Morus notabilis]|uniref:protein FAR1-RELATED SEQUENCE 5-like n=1 Tax=Morus notabilis TaxID=981085 RepID=UPI000CED0FD8|nr:protein FAR1-RELATED SEQUENCE 5-like [Morus notabilis]
MIGYIRCLARNHGEDFYYVYNADEENRLYNIMWSDGVSRIDYAVFGNVLALDTTYRTNKYHKPLLLLMFLQGMNNRKPKVVVTDGDNAMKNAITQVFPESKHRLCGWHLMENVANNVKDINFKWDFKEIMYGYYSEPEFLDMWHSLILAYELENNYWATCMFEKRESWAETYLRGNFCAGMRTTQHSESMNRIIRQLVDSTKSLTDFVSLVDHAINKLRHKDLQDDFSTRHSTPSLRHAYILNPYYQHAASLFTRRIYTKKVSHEIKLIHAYTVRQVDEIDRWAVHAKAQFQTRYQTNNEVPQEILELTRSYRDPPLVRQQESIDEINPFEVLKDPIVVQNKGTVRRPQVGPSAQEELGLERLKRKCAMCKGHGHNKQTCPLKKDKAKTMLTCSEGNDDSTHPTQMSL